MADQIDSTTAQPGLPAAPMPGLPNLLGNVMNSDGAATEQIIRAAIAVQNAFHPNHSIPLGDSPAASQAKAQGAANPVPPVVAPPVSTGLAGALNALGGGSNVTFWSGLGTMVAHSLLNAAGVVGSPVGGGSTVVGQVLGTLGASGALAGLFGKLGTIAPVLLKIIALIPK